MPAPSIIPAWKTAPFLRLLFPLIAGIMLQHYLRLGLQVIVAALIFFSIAFFLFLFLPMAIRFKWSVWQGAIMQLWFIALGALLCWNKDISHHAHWYGNYYRQGSYLVVRINEPLVQKNRSFKADGFVEGVINNGRTIPCKGRLLLYFARDSLQNKLQYADRIIIHKPLQRIRNSGNPGAFDYERYAAFQGIFHNIFLKEGDWVQTTTSPANSRFRRFLFNARDHVLGVLQQHIRSGKDELGIAQALLIGYTNDLDKDLVQAYSNTGVVHIIAISGMHLALIYLLLTRVFAGIPVIRGSKLMQLVLVLVCLWLFSLLTGASASVLRAAVMFTSIAIGKSLKKEASVYSSLAASAFLLLCYDPFYLWSVGFQLSYLAVLGIVIFQRPVYDLFYVRNKWIDIVWKLAAVSIAAQLLTFPACIYYFHQFPNLFLITNIIAVPLSSLILYAAIALVAFSWVPFMAEWLGTFTGWVTWIMNKFILWVNQVPFAVWDRIPATVLSTWILYVVVICLSSWLLLHNRKYLVRGLVALLGFSFVMGAYNWSSSTQQKIIIYNIPKHQAVDLVSGHNYQFIGDSILMNEGILQNFHLKPGRIAFQQWRRKDSLPALKRHGPLYMFHNKRILIIARPFQFSSVRPKVWLDLVVISNNAAVEIEQLTEIFSCRLIVFDASNSRWKIKKWQQDCILLKQPFFIVERYGAFVYNIGI